jgi:hypothetical protein
MHSNEMQQQYCQCQKRNQHERQRKEQAAAWAPVETPTPGPPETSIHPTHSTMPIMAISSTHISLQFIGSLGISVMKGKM